MVLREKFQLNYDPEDLATGTDWRISHISPIISPIIAPFWVHSVKLTIAGWKMDQNWRQMYFLLNMGIFHCYVSLPEAIFLYNNGDCQFDIVWDLHVFVA